MDWLPSLDFSFLGDMLAQAPSANSSAVGQVDMLRQQIEFLVRENARQTGEFTEKLKLITDENAKLSESFKNFITTMQFALAGFGVVSTVITGAIAYVFKSNLDDAKRVAREAINQRVETYVTELMDSKIDAVRRTLRKEEVIGSTGVDYCLLEMRAAPIEMELLDARGFLRVEPRSQVHSLKRSSARVVVLDLENWVNPQGVKFPALPEVEREQEAKRQVELMLEILPIERVLVVYVRSQVKYLFSVPKDRYVTPANNPVTLVGMVADAAYVAAGMRN